MLYADLMLRIGHECMQWNKNIQTNDNYMFRRWLRKLSHKFDWQERRMQALSLALEAAAGSKSIARYKHWVVQRSNKSEDSTPVQTNALKPDEVPSNDADGELTEEERKSAIEADTKRQFEEEKRMLLERNSMELEAFDKTTTEINLSGRTDATQQSRESSRGAMIMAHKEAVIALENEFNQANAEGNKMDVDDYVLGTESANFPISASCRQVCAIACELAKHLIGLKLYEGARLVGEGVSAYFKERAARCDKRIRSRQRHDEYQKKLAQSPLMLQSFEEV